jgi:molecular chaperone GrpE
MSEKKNKDWKQFKENSLLEDEQEIDELIEDPEEELMASLDHPTYVEMEEKLTLAEQKAHENWEKSVRALAELDNVRRRAERDIANAHRYGSEKLLTSLLPIVDSLEQALQLAEGDKAMHEGLELTMKLFLDVLQKHDVEQIDPIGEPFDPQCHEAMTMQPSTEVAPNHVVAVFQKGYRLNDRIIRPARVIVAKN